MKIKYALLKQEEGKRFCYVNEVEKPYYDHYFYNDKEGEYQFELKKWKSNHKRFEVHKDYEEKFINLCRTMSIEKVLVDKYGSFLPALKLGIEIPAEKIGTIRIPYIHRFITYAIILPESEFKRCGEGDNTCNCKNQNECGYTSKDKKCECDEPIADNHNFCMDCGNKIEENINIIDKSGYIINKDSQDELITSRELNHLEWIHERLQFVHKENPFLDYMQLFSIIINKLKQNYDIKKKRHG